ncbi:MAG: hypothetical protein IE933_08810 [Sphingomonadales bacterium]|nr:hypothetical protein [Sphingomonadales bacterium]MBD3773281.1 hypothetical protein [Paracoccaceae bacterium]
MSGIEQRLREDKAVRDAARAVVEADVAYLKSIFAPAQLAARAGDEAAQLFERASEAADDNKGVLAALLAAVLIWFARNPIMALFDDDRGSEEDEYSEEPEGGFAGSADDEV